MKVSREVFVVRVLALWKTVEVCVTGALWSDRVNFTKIGRTTLGNLSFPKLRDRRQAATGKLEMDGDGSMKLKSLFFEICKRCIMTVTKICRLLNFD